MFLAPYKIFTISKGKRILNPEGRKLVGIHDAKRFNYDLACKIAENNDCVVSVLLGNVVGDIKLICLDLDDCYTPEGELDKNTEEFLKEFKEEEYETSSSGEGVHVYILTKLDLPTFIVKELEGCKSFECYTSMRHIVVTLFDFENTNLKVGAHDKFLLDLYQRVEEQKKAREPNRLEKDCIEIFEGERVDSDVQVREKVYKRKSITDMFELRKIGYKDPMLIQVIDENPDAVDQSAHDAKLIRKLMYYTLSFNLAREVAKKTNYYKAKDDKHKKKFDDPRYIERTKDFIMKGKI